jgi:hypothetical protein
MLLSVELPDPIAKQLRLDGEQGSQRALEMLALEGYRSVELSRGQVTELLGQSFYENEAISRPSSSATPPFWLTTRKPEARRRFAAF